MPEKKEYRNARRSRKLIRDAFMELLHEKPYEKITATDVINRADVNRSTFYAHYPDLRGLVEEILNEIVDASAALIAQLDYRSLFEDPTPFLRPLIQIGEEYREIYSLIGQSFFVYQQTEKIKSAFLAKALTAPELPEEMRGNKKYAIRVTFFIGGILDIYQRWIQGELDCTSEEIIQEICEMIISSTNAILRPEAKQ